MAVSVSFPPCAMGHGDPMFGNFAEATGAFGLSCGFQGVPGIKSEPVQMEDSMESSYASTTYTELSPATFSQLKQGQTELYPEIGNPQAFSSWTFKHPSHWEAREVLDWVFSLTEVEEFDGALFCGEAYNTLTGQQLSEMRLQDFQEIDPNYGDRVHQIFQWMLEDANFKKPCPPDSFKSEVVGNVPDFAFLDRPTDPARPQSTRPHSANASSMGSLSVFLDRNGKEVSVSLEGLGCYDIDISIDDSDYHSGSDADLGRSSSVSSDVFEPMFSDDDEESRDVLIPGVCKKPHTLSSSSSASSDSGCELEERRHCTRRRQPAATKGNHLWEFVRDMLKDARFNPSLLKWEDKEMGVFRFVQSEAIASMWGRKKNNPGMTYEKLSRAMRFCRSAGYFNSVPKTGRFPKKLCFMFGQKAQGWRD